jgi:hypothetical protein
MTNVKEYAVKKIEFKVNGNVTKVRLVLLEFQTASSLY